MFKKWVSIDNHYQSKTIERFVRFNPELFTEKYLVTEKIDGANFSITYDPITREPRFFKRSGPAEETFYDYKTVMESEEMLKFHQIAFGLSQLIWTRLQFVGELFGEGIQKRLNYGPKKWRWFAIIRHDEVDGIPTSRVLNPRDVTDLLHKLDDHDFELMVGMMVPTLAYVECNGDINDMINQVEELIQRDSWLTPKDHEGENLMEGAVIRPYTNNYFYGDSMFILKVKNEKFKDKQRVKVKKPANHSEALKSAFAVGALFINENRTADLFSKMGEIEEPKQMGEYIKAYFLDFFDDFIKEGHGALLDGLKKAEIKMFNKEMNRRIVDELKKHL